jgi:hypothetical protein
MAMRRSARALRDVFRVLAAQGPVSLLFNCGTVIHQLSTKDGEETFEKIGGREAISGEFPFARNGSRDPSSAGAWADWYTASPTRQATATPWFRGRRRATRTVGRLQRAAKPR